jgi:hypothetical protein
MISSRLRGKNRNSFHSLFKTDLWTSLITSGLYINIILTDYVRTIIGLNRTNSTWTLDPRAEMGKL